MFPEFSRSLFHCFFLVASDADPPSPNPETVPLQEVFLDSMFIFLRLGNPPPSCSFFPEAKFGEGRRPLSERRASSPPQSPPFLPKGFCPYRIPVRGRGVH
ncbi:hypothetical protein WCP94_002034 [Bilophila wadsworthia]